MDQKDRDKNRVRLNDILKYNTLKQYIPYSDMEYSRFANREFVFHLSFPVWIWFIISIFLNPLSIPFLKFNICFQSHNDSTLFCLTEAWVIKGDHNYHMKLAHTKKHISETQGIRDPAFKSKTGYTYWVCPGANGK